MGSYRDGIERVREKQSFINERRVVVRLNWNRFKIEQKKNTPSVIGKFSSEREGSDGCGGESKACNNTGCAGLRGNIKRAIVKWLHDSVVSVTAGEILLVGEVLGELLELRLADGLHLLDDGPLEALSARRRGEGALVGPVLRHVDSAHEVTEGNLGRARE